MSAKDRVLELQDKLLELSKERDEVQLKIDADPRGYGLEGRDELNRIGNETTYLEGALGEAKRIAMEEEQAIADAAAEAGMKNAIAAAEGGRQVAPTPSIGERARWGRN